MGRRSCPLLTLCLVAGMALAGCVAPSSLPGDFRFPPTYGAVMGGPSVLVSYSSGASTYSGIGRYEGRATCTALFLDTAVGSDDPQNAPAYALTSGHCIALPDPNDVLIDRPGFGRVIFNYFKDSQSRQVSVPVARVA